MSVVHWLGQEECHHTHVVGGKAASLSRLAKLHTVPPGFAIPALEARSEALPDTTINAIHEAYGELGKDAGEPDLSVAVRSSAIDEDAAGASFAGQHDTYLNVRGEVALLEAVLRCRDSAISPGALAYRKRQGLLVEGIRIGILVQQLIASDVSAIIFSTNPLTKNADEIVINASWGLGESLVGGTVTPDTYVVRKSDLSVTSRQVAKKEQMTVMVPEGTKEVPVPKLLSEEPTLNDEQAIEMAEMAVKLEQATGHPVDIECAIAQGTLYLLQCRPITTL
ncbi:MAG: PEP/pyruvate-binding domain-containing protein [Chloroflexi bacterium]|nr:PEP/pyruvate-binding domain-containing protein [Chloroflexota bacterium]